MLFYDIINKVQYKLGNHVSHLITRVQQENQSDPLCFEFLYILTSMSLVI